MTLTGRDWTVNVQYFLADTPEGDALWMLIEGYTKGDDWDRPVTILLTPAERALVDAALALQAARDRRVTEAHARLYWG